MVRCVQRGAYDKCRKHRWAGSTSIDDKHKTAQRSTQQRIGQLDQHGESRGIWQHSTGSGRSALPNMEAAIMAVRLSIRIPKSLPAKANKTADSASDYNQQLQSGQEPDNLTLADLQRCQHGRSVISVLPILYDHSLSSVISIPLMTPRNHPSWLTGGINHHLKTFIFDTKGIFP